MGEGVFMIPKTIHYCWFGGKQKPKLAQRCIESWKKYCPDYEIIEWNESNFDVNQNPYTKLCYQQQKWAFLSDYVRLWAVFHYGGIYFDTDVEVLRSFDSLLSHEAFYGFESSEYIASGLGFGAVAHHATTEAMLKKYDALTDEFGNLKTVGCPTLNTEALISLGMKPNGEKQTVAGAVLLPVDYLNPLEDATGIVRKTKNTLSIHWYTKSALDWKIVLRSRITRPLHRLFGKDCFAVLKKFLRR